MVPSCPPHQPSVPGGMAGTWFSPLSSLPLLAAMGELSYLCFVERTLFVGDVSPVWALTLCINCI